MDLRSMTQILSHACIYEWNSNLQQVTSSEHSLKHLKHELSTWPILSGSKVTLKLLNNSLKTPSVQLLAVIGFCSFVKFKKWVYIIILSDGFVWE